MARFSLANPRSIELHSDFTAVTVKIVCTALLFFLSSHFSFAVSAQYPNEPAGYVPFAEAPLDVLPQATTAQRLGNTPAGWTGKWFYDPSYGTANCYLSSDPTAPQSPPSVYVTRFPANFASGRGPCFIGGWDAAGPTGAGYKNSFYFSFWLKINNNTTMLYENNGVLTKMGWVAYGSTASVSTNPGFFTLLDNDGSGNAFVSDKFKVGFNQQGFVDRNLGPTGGLLQTVGVWHHWEALFIVNNPANNYNCPDQYGNPHDCGDGVFRMWIDGVKVNDHTNMAFAETGNLNPFYSYIWNPTWGGGGPNKLQTDYMYIDHIYMSEPGSGVAVCGNGVIESGEQCDGTNLNGATCASRGFTGGTLNCSATTCQYVTTACNNGSVDLTPPTATITSPTNNQILSSGTTTYPMAVTTNEAATCRRSATDLPYSSMPSGNTLTGGGTTSHTAMLTPLSNGGSYTQYVRCIDIAGNEMTTSSTVTFTVASNVTKTGDLNNDGIVNILDVQRVVSKLGQTGVTTGEDVNADSVVNLFDLVVLARNWG